MTQNPSTMPEAERAQYRGRLMAEGEQVHRSSAPNDASSMFASYQQEQAAQERQRVAEGQNVGPAERQTSLAAGGILALLGLARRDLVGLAIAAVGGSMIHRGATGTCYGYKALGINTAIGNTPVSATEFGDGGRLQSLRQDFQRGLRVAQAFTVGKSKQECYDFWRKLDNLPRIMTHIEEVRVLDNRRSHWVAKAPKLAGGRYEWDAEIVEDSPGERIAWRSLDGADIDNAGVVRFEESPRGTIVRAEISYVPPGGRLGNMIVSLLGQSPDRVLREDLRNFKRVMEIGEVLTIIGQPHGTCTGQGKRYDEANSYKMPPTA
jgi:uncharacterized membrane protein